MRSATIERKEAAHGANQCKERRRQLIDGLLAASTNAERAVIRRGRRAGRKLRAELEGMVSG